MITELNQIGVPAVSALHLPHWEKELRNIVHILKVYHPYATRYFEIQPIENDSSIRDDLRSMAPGLAEFSDLLEHHMHSGACGVYIPMLGLDKYDLDTRSLLVYALGLCIGSPTQTDQVQRRVIWDVKPRSTAKEYFPTFSETNQEATFHTDTQYYPHPEKYFFLYVQKPAACLGGSSQLCDARMLRSWLLQTDRGWIIDKLSRTLLPFRIPTAFSTMSDPKGIQATIAPIFSDEPFIRYRRDTLLEGIAHFPAYCNAEMTAAIEEFDKALQLFPVKANIFMPRDSLMFVNNHIALHARTSFTDRSRHLQRIRLHEREKIFNNNQVTIVEKIRNNLL